MVGLLVGHTAGRLPRDSFSRGTVQEGGRGMVNPALRKRIPVAAGSPATVHHRPPYVRPHVRPGEPAGRPGKLQAQLLSPK